MRYIALLVLVFTVAACSSPSHTAPAAPTSTVTVTATPADQPTPPTVPSSTVPTPTLQTGCVVENRSSGSDIKITMMNDGTQTVYVSLVTYYLFDSSGNLMSHEDDTQFPSEEGRTVGELAVKAHSYVWYRDSLFSDATATSCRITWWGGFVPGELGPERALRPF